VYAIFVSSRKLQNFHKKNSLKKQEGLTLVEVLVSLVLVSIVLISFFVFFSQTTLFSGKNEEKLVAFHLASKTLSIVENKYRNTTMASNNLSLNCGNFPPEIETMLYPSSCFYKNNNKNYYPEITLTKQNDLPSLYVIHIKMFSSANVSERTLLSETFGYVRVR
jgi:prepilin-type N-terminal cleavage/methylation domain-containing protein